MSAPAIYKTINEDRLECPECGQKVVGIEDWEIYDGVCMWLCTKCVKYWARSFFANDRRYAFTNCQKIDPEATED